MDRPHGELSLEVSDVLAVDEVGVTVGHDAALHSGRMHCTLSHHAITSTSSLVSGDPFGSPSSPNQAIASITDSPTHPEPNASTIVKIVR